MEIRDFARRVVESACLDEKLAPPPGRLTDRDPGPPVRIAGPARPAGLAIAHVTETRVPGPGGMADPAQRPRLLHALANHELQAAELYAWALLAFPEAPADFRRGLVAILRDEQRHTRMYVARLRAYGVRLGDFPVSGYFWNKVGQLTTPLRFVCAMALTFENANLDHTVDLAGLARNGGDAKTAAVIDQVHRDEVEHVRFGWKWLGILKEEGQTEWEAFRANLTWPLRPAKAKGRRFHRRGREAAGMDAEFIARLEAARL
jgi:uncharacterized ferritin-like protein (DUF455 family)